MAPVVPPTIRDFSVFEQHVAGIVKLRDPSALVPEEWYEAPAAYFTNTHAHLARVHWSTHGVIR